MRYRFHGWTVGIVVLAFVAAVSQAYSGEPVLDRLEKAIRKQVEQGEQPERVPLKPAAPAAEPPAPAGAEAKAAEAAETGFLGAVTDDRADRGRGLRVLSVRPQGPADQAGLKADDLIVAIAGTRVRQQSDFSDVLALFPPGDTILLDVQREGKTIALKVTLGRRPADAARPQEVKPPVLNPGGVPPGGALPGDDDTAALKRRVAELEKRVADLEQALGDLLNRK